MEWGTVLLIRLVGVPFGIEQRLQNPHLAVLDRPVHGVEAVGVSRIRIARVTPVPEGLGGFDVILAIHGPEKGLVDVFGGVLPDALGDLGFIPKQPRGHARSRLFSWGAPHRVRWHLNGPLPGVRIPFVSIRLFAGPALLSEPRPRILLLLAAGFGGGLLRIRLGLSILDFGLARGHLRGLGVRLALNLENGG